MTREVKTLTWWLYHPRAEILVRSEHFQIKACQDLFRLCKANLKHNDGKFISCKEITDKIASDERFRYLYEDEWTCEHITIPCLGLPYKFLPCGDHDFRLYQIDMIRDYEKGIQAKKH